MSGWLLDTNVLSELRKPRPNTNVTTFVAGQQLERLYVSVVTFAEIRYGIERLDDPLRRSEISQWLDNHLRPLFENRILPLSEDVLLVWRLMLQAGLASGHTYSHPDVLVAATAANFGLTVVTRDVREFEAAGIEVLNPWVDGHD